MKDEAQIPAEHKRLHQPQAHEMLLLPGVHLPGYLFCHAHPNNECTAFRQSARDHSSRQPIC